jgi:hypothetical protein
MLEVAQWAVENTPADRLCSYGDDRPIQVRVKPYTSRQIVWLRKGTSGRLIPGSVGVDSFLRAWVDDL